VEFGDWQTPLPLASEVVTALREQGLKPTLVVEPTCGVGSFLAAARTAWPGAQIFGFEINAAYVEQARAALGDGAHVELSDFFTTAWEKRLGTPSGPVRSGIAATGACTRV
jgi:trans-aconitate methyltransferase